MKRKFTAILTGSSPRPKSPQLCIPKQVAALREETSGGSRKSLKAWCMSADDTEMPGACRTGEEWHRTSKRLPAEELTLALSRKSARAQRARLEIARCWCFVESAQ